MKVLTEADTFTPTVTVPEGMDSRNNAADHVEAIAQALANRTNTLNLHGVRKDAVNVFTAGQQFNITDPGTAAFDSVSTPAAGGVAGNVWKLQHQWNMDGKRVRVYSGNGDPLLGHWCFTTNAYWDDSVAQLWFQDDPAHESNILRCFRGELHFYGKAAGSLPWNTSSWDTTRGHVRIGDGTYSKNFIAVDDFLYGTPPTRRVELMPQLGFDLNLDIKRLSPAESDIWHILVPSGATLTDVHIKVQAYTANYYLRLYRKHGINHSSGTLPTLQMVAELDEGGGVSGIFNHTLSFGGLTVNNETEQYWLYALCKNLSPGDLDVYAAQAVFVDPGPRNH